MKFNIFTISLLILCLSSCTSYDIMRNNKYVGHYKVGKSYKINKQAYHPKEVSVFEQVGLASWYGDDFHGNKTANGETFDKTALTAAHTTLPIPSLVKVTNLENKNEVIVRINDRGPFVQSKPLKRIIDLSEKAAETLGMKEKGVARVKITLLPTATKLLHKKLNINQESKKETFASRKSSKTQLL